MVNINNYLFQHQPLGKDCLDSVHSAGSHRRRGADDDREPAAEFLSLRLGTTFVPSSTKKEEEEVETNELQTHTSRGHRMIESDDDDDGVILALGLRCNPGEPTNAGAADPKRQKAISICGEDGDGEAMLHESTGGKNTLPAKMPARVVSFRARCSAATVSACKQ